MSHQKHIIAIDMLDREMILAQSSQRGKHKEMSSGPSMNKRGFPSHLLRRYYQFLATSLSSSDCAILRHSCPFQCIQF